MAHNFGQVKTPAVYLDFLNYYLHSGYQTYNLVGGGIYEDPNKNTHWTYLDPYRLKENSMVGDAGNGVDFCRYSFHNSMVDGTAIDDAQFPAYAVLGANINYLAILSHELGGEHSQYGLTSRKANNPGTNILLDVDGGLEHLNIVEQAQNKFRIPQHGSTIVKFKDHTTMVEDGGILSLAVRIYSDIGTALARNPNPHFGQGIGAISMGTFFKFPQSPDMQVKMSREYDFVRHQETMSGKSFSQVSSLGATFGHGEQPFGLYNYEEFMKVEDGLSLDWNKYSEKFNKFKRVGRRIWDVSWSQIGADDLFHAYESGNFSNEDVLASGISDGEHGNINTWDGIPLLHDSPIFQMITYTQAGRLPFIWQPDSDDNTPLGFCLAKIDMRSFTVTQSSFERYSFKLRIREVW